MADPVEYTVDTSELTAGIRAFSDKITLARRAAALAVGFEILRLSSLEVPHDKGTLQNSGTVQVIDDSVIVGYHTPYAARLHEHPEYRFQKGRKGRYLVDPIIKNAAVLGLKLTDELAKGMSK
jgi:hypothetical protein